MASLFHFIFELVKISILSCAYGYLFYLIFKIIGHYKPESWFNRVSKKIIKSWLISGFIISICLFFYLFSYWGNHGLGDSARIPLGYKKEIRNIDWAKYATFNEILSSDNNEIEMTKFKLQDNKLCGNYASDFYTFEKAYFIYDLKTSKLFEFNTVKDYDTYANKHKFPKSTELLGFQENYRNYWSGWRFFFLP